MGSLLARRARDRQSRVRTRASSFLFHTRTHTNTHPLHTTTPLHHHPNTPPPPHLPLFGSRPKRREPSEAAALLTPARQAPRWSGELASVTPPVSALHVYCQAPRWGGSARASRRRSLRRGPTATSAAGRGGPQTRGGAGPRAPRAFIRNSGPSAHPCGCADVSLGAARRAWGIPLAGGASPLPRVKYPGHYFAVRPRKSVLSSARHELQGAPGTGLVPCQLSTKMRLTMPMESTKP